MIYVSASRLVPREYGRQAANRLQARLIGAWTGSASAALVAIALAAPTLAQGNPDSAEGIVTERCATCHQVPDHAPPYLRLGLDAPTFQSIADHSEYYTRSRLTAIVRQPHYPMNTFILSTVDVTNVVAYILRLGAQADQ